MPEAVGTMPLSIQLPDEAAAQCQRAEGQGVMPQSPIEGWATDEPAEQIPAAVRWHHKHLLSLPCTASARCRRQAALQPCWKTELRAHDAECSDSGRSQPSPS